MEANYTLYIFFQEEQAKAFVKSEKRRAILLNTCKERKKIILHFQFRELDLDNYL